MCHPSAASPQLEQKLPLCLIGGRVLRGLCTHTARLPLPSHESPESSIAPRTKSPSKPTRPPPRIGVLNRARSYCLVGLVGPQHGSTTIESREGPPVGCGSVQLRRSRHTIRGGKKDSGERWPVAVLKRNQRRRRECTAERESPSSSPRPAHDAHTFPPVDSSTIVIKAVRRGAAPDPLPDA